MPDLNLGVIDVAYAPDGARPEPRITKKGKVHKADADRGEDTGPTTTVTVAQALESRYHVFQAFYDQYETEIGAAVVHSLEGAIEDLYAGSPVHNPFAEVGQEVTEAFRTFLLSGEIETLGIDGVPTQAALERRSSRFKSGQSTGPRPSFIDTATYELAARVWVD